jgi:hypothetical protein
MMHRGAKDSEAEAAVADMTRKHTAAHIDEIAIAKLCDIMERNKSPSQLE